MVHDKVDKEQINRATAINTKFTINNEEKTAEDLGFNTNLEKAQEVTKDKEKHLNAELHTDLLDKEERDKIVLAGRKIGTVIEALTEDKGVDKLETYKVGLRATHIDELRKEREKEFAFVDDENTSPLDKLRALRDLQVELYKKEGYKGISLGSQNIGTFGGFGYRKVYQLNFLNNSQKDIFRKVINNRGNIKNTVEIIKFLREVNEIHKMNSVGDKNENSKN